MNATTAQPRTTAELLAVATEHAQRHPLNREYHRDQYIAHRIAADERAAYAAEDRRTVRDRYLDALEVRGLCASPDDFTLIALAEQGELITPAELLATVPDEYGRVSPFALTVYVAPTGRSYTSRNHSLIGAVEYAQREIAKGNRASVHFDLCG